MKVIEKVNLRELKDPLVAHISEELNASIQNFIKANPFCDSEDLKKQVLFRFLTFKPEEIFEKGESIQEYLEQVGAYRDWRTIASLDSDFIGRFKLNRDLVYNVLHEQSIVIAERLDDSRLPLKLMLKRTGMFDEEGWIIKKTDGKTYAVCRGYSIFGRHPVSLQIKEIETSYATQIFNDLHYVHSPRVEFSYGIFVEGNAVPFAVIGGGRVKRQYKRTALTSVGYNPDNCWELTRQYNRIGSPMNTSSFIMGSTVKFITDKYPETEAFITTIAPSLENGHSMLSGSFTDPILAKYDPLMFGAVDKNKIPERVTRTRSRNCKEIIYNKIPLLPKIILARYIKNRPLTRQIGETEMMLCENGDES